ncbi:MAG: CZB domain-containing protein [Paracoccaceae bacterium]
MSTANETVEAIWAAIGAHGVWKMRLKTAITLGKSDLTVANVCRDDLCDFGKWLNSPSLPAALRQSDDFRTIRARHAEFHKCAGDVLGLALSGQKDAALTRLDGDFAAQSQGLALAMRQWSNGLAAAKVG